MRHQASFLTLATLLAFCLLDGKQQLCHAFATTRKAHHPIPGRRSTTSLPVFFGGKEKTTNRDITRTTQPNIKGMPDVERDLQTIKLEKEEQEMAMSLAGAELSLEKLLFPFAVAVAAFGLTFAANSAGFTVADASQMLDAFKEDPQGFLQSSLDGMGSLAIAYFGLLYVVAELLAIPATPLTLSSGALFGWTEGTLVVLAAGTISAMIGFLIGKTFLRQWVENILEENPKFQKLDTAIGAEGFKLLVLVRLSPIFPFSLLNYTYGASSISFPTFVAGTLLGFTPSTIGYVYTGMVGKELLLGEGSQPWYVYAGGVTLLLAFLKLVTDVATNIVEAIDDDNGVTPMER